MEAAEEQVLRPLDVMGMATSLHSGGLQMSKMRVLAEVTEPGGYMGGLQVVEGGASMIELFIRILI